MGATGPVRLTISRARGLAITGCASSGVVHTATANAEVSGTQEISVVIHHTNLLFVTASGTSSHDLPGPLTPGDRVLGRDDIQQHGSDVGSDYEVCTVGFGLNVLCDDMINITNVGQLHVTWAFQWPASGATGPTSWSGVVDGGTDGYQNAIGTFQAQARPSGDVNITLHISRARRGDGD